MPNVNHKPVLIVIAGPNGSGKTSVTSKILHHEWLEDSEYINPDNVARDIFGDWNNQDAVIKAANYCNEWRERCLAERRNHIFETVMSATDKVDYILRAKAAGFFIRLFFVSTESPTINAKRVAYRVLKGGHDVPIPKIISRYDKSIANCIAIAPYVDRLYVYDNSIDDVEARLLFRLSDGKLVKRYTNALPQWAAPILHGLVVGIGEVLWDMLPTGKRLGGAPANFAYHAAMNGCNAAIVSAVGCDALGDEILTSLESKPLECHIARTPHPTGTVAVDLNATGIPHYTIAENVAWDNIPFTDDLAATAKRTAAVCFGSLARRSSASRVTIDKFLNALPPEALIVFDANLRGNFYCADDLSRCISRCNILKLNDEELPVVADLLGLTTSDDATANEPDELCRLLIKRYNLNTIILTCGTAGSHVFTSAGEHSFLPTPRVKVADTVGAGDSFTAAYVTAILHGSTPTEAHAAAVRTAAYVCIRPGAMPEYQAVAH